MVTIGEVWVYKRIIQAHLAISIQIISWFNYHTYASWNFVCNIWNMVFPIWLVINKNSQKLCFLNFTYTLLINHQFQAGLSGSSLW